MKFIIKEKWKGNTKIVNCTSAWNCTDLQCEESFIFATVSYYNTKSQ